MIFEPFGGLVLLLLFAVAFVIGLIVVIVGRKRTVFVFAGVGIMIAPWLTMIFLHVPLPTDEVDEWNPRISSDAEVVGVWIGEGFYVELNKDSTHIIKRNEETSQGTWRRDDWNLYLTSSDKQAKYMRFVTGSDDQLLLLAELPPDRHSSGKTGPILKREQPTSSK